MSSIKVAFIPPKGMTHYASQGNIVMCLAQLLNDPYDTGYTDTMKRLSNKKYTLLDNGANEGVVFSNASLMHAAKYLETDEVVLPDVLGDSIATYDAAISFLKSEHDNKSDTSYMYMGVVQGTNNAQLHNLIDWYAIHSGITTLGLPRLLLNITQSIRIDTATWIEEHYPKRFAIHFLGASSLWPKEPYYANKYAPHVRSIDTSLPFNYGLAGVVLENFEGVTTQQIDRPENYFTRWHASTARTTVNANMTIYKEWCSGKTSPSGELS